MSKYVFIRLLTIAAVGSVYACAQENSVNLDDLLSQYRSTSDLSNQTKKESAGSLIVYTREQLEKMQAFNLRDILKTIPLFTMQETYSAQVTLAKAKGSTFNSQFLKLYINDHEVGSIGFGSAMIMWGYLDISYIDHIEVYQAGSAVMPGDEPAGFVIRLYSKDPKREDGGSIQAIHSSRNSNELNGYYAYKGKEYTGLFYANTHTENRIPYQSGRSTVGVDRDFQTTNFFASLQGNDFTLEAAQFNLEQDRLLGFGNRRTPLDNRADMLHRYLIGTKYFQDRTLYLRLSYDHAHHQQSESDPNGITLFNSNATKSTVKEWYFDNYESIVDAVVDKAWSVGKHDIHAGVQTKIKKITVKSLTTDGIERSDEISGPDSWRSHSAFFSDDLTLDEHNLIFANLKFDRYDLNGGGEDNTDYVLRLGHVYNDGKWIWKTFGTRTYGYPVFLQTTYFPSIYKNNTSLKNESRLAASTEVSYTTGTSVTNLRVIYNTAKNAISMKNNVFVNSTATPEFYSIYAGHDLRIGANHRINLTAYYGKDDMPLTQSSQHGGLLQFFNTFGPFDLYNEIVYRSGFHYVTSAPANQSVDVKAGFDYTAGITYRATKDLSFFLKGENLLNKAIRIPYPAQNHVDYISPFDRTVRTGIKYVF